jgi:hypothetical protein
MWEGKSPVVPGPISSCAVHALQVHTTPFSPETTSTQGKFAFKETALTVLYRFDSFRLGFFKVCNKYVIN